MVIANTCWIWIKKGKLELTNVYHLMLCCQHKTVDCIFLWWSPHLITSCNFFVLFLAQYFCHSFTALFQFYLFQDNTSLTWEFEFPLIKREQSQETRIRLRPASIQGGPKRTQHLTRNFSNTIGQMLLIFISLGRKWFSTQITPGSSISGNAFWF